MGHKINPISFRIGITRNWESRWFPKNFDFKKFLQQDDIIRKTITKQFPKAGIVMVEVERLGTGEANITIQTARPGLIIGRSGENIDTLKKNLLKALQRKTGVGLPNMKINVEELKRSETAAAVVAEGIASDLERRIPFRRVIRQVLERLNQHKEVRGVKIQVSGRLDGAEIARDGTFKVGRMPTTTLKANIDYALREAITTYGVVGVKVWLYKGSIE